MAVNTRLRMKNTKGMAKKAVIFAVTLAVGAGLLYFFSPSAEKAAGLIISRASKINNFAQKILYSQLSISSGFSYPESNGSEQDGLFLSDRSISEYNLSGPAAGSDTEGFAEECPTDGQELAESLSAKPITAITIAPASALGYAQSGNIYIKNETNYNVDIEASLKKELDLDMSGKDAKVLIIHTHGSESYSEQDKKYYTPSDKDRSEDKSKNVIEVGNKLEQILTKNGIKVIHVTDIFDYPEYDGAYSRALNAISEQVKKNPSIEVIIDLHRDSMVNASGEKYKTVTRINGKNAAQMMFVCGSNQGSLPHANWQQNLRIMIRLQQKINEKYPNLMRPINLRAARFNQHVCSGAMLVEVGTSGNTLDEAIYSAELFGNELAEFLKSA